MTDLRITQLDSGLTVATEHVPGALSVATGVWVGVGSRDEPAELSGRQPLPRAPAVQGHADALGAGDLPRRSTASAATSTPSPPRSTRRTTAGCRRVTPTFGVELLGDVLTRPALRDADVDSERQVILEELAMDDDSPDDVAQRTFAAQLFADHPLGRETAGDRDTVQAITADDVRRFFDVALPRRRRWWSRSPAPSTTTRSCAEVAAAFADVPHRRRSHRRATAPGGDRATSVAIDDDTEQVHIVDGRPGAAAATTPTARRSTSSTTCSAAACRAACSTRSASGAASPTRVYSASSAYADAGAFRMYAGTQPEHAGEVHRPDARASSTGWSADGITDDELTSPSATSPAPSSSASRTPARAWRRIGGLLTTPGQVRAGRRAGRPLGAASTTPTCGA